ncbi:MAG TPA: hypothetical protein VNS11_06040 [Sphingomicrobium sp.]|nr:hypothetical protein [Sphingomicrobium sp.]
MAARRPKRILIASANPWSFCMAVERELAAIHSEDEVDAIDLFTLCGKASPHWRRRDKIIESLNRKIDRFVMPAINGRNITSEIHIERAPVPPLPRTYAELRKYELGGAKLGLAVLSSVSSLTTIQFPESLAEYGAVLKPAWQSAHLSLRAGEVVRGLGYDRIHIFNGRHCYSRPFCDVLDQASEVIRYEQGSAGNRYITAPGPVQHPVEIARLMEEHRLDGAAGESFYRERFEKHASSEASFFTAPQRSGALPETLEGQKIVTFFTSSSDELFAAFDDTSYGSFANQHEIALAVADICKAQGLRLVVRLHPHLRFKHRTWTREWDFAELKRRGVLVLEPEDPTDSYELLRSCYAVISTGSTVGIEASYLGIPNAVVGICVAGCLGASVVADTTDELARFILKPELPPNAREAALRFGSFYKTGGKLLPELDVGIHPNMARIDGRIVDPVRYAAQKLRFLFRRPADPDALDVRSGMQAGRVLLPPGTDYSSAYGKAATSGGTKFRRASTENSLSGE